MKLLKETLDELIQNLTRTFSGNLIPNQIPGKNLKKKTEGNSTRIPLKGFFSGKSTLFC